MENGLHKLDRVARAELGTKTWLGFAGRTKKCVGSLLTARTYEAGRGEAGLGSARSTCSRSTAEQCLDRNGQETK